MKMNVPLDEAEECVRKVKERNMGYLFENMEKMDIQEERRKTAEARKDAEEAKRLAQQQVEEAQKRACDQVMEMRRDAMRNMVLLCKRLGVSEETAAQELMNACGIDRRAALEAVELYWEASVALAEEEK